MPIIELDPRFPTAIPLEASGLLSGDVAYTEEVPIRVRWAIADAGGHSVETAEVLITTDVANEIVRDRLAAGERLLTAGTNALPDAPAAAPGSSRPDDVDGDGDGGAHAVAGAEDAAAADADAGAGAEDGSTGAGALPNLEEAVRLMALARRRGEWEAGRTHASLLPHLIEETYEFVDAVNEDGDVRGELSDLLLQVLFHAEIAEDFDIEDVAADFVSKLRERSPYLFEEGAEDGPVVPVDEQERAWDAGRGGPRSMPASQMPALALAEEVIRRARRAGVADADIPADLMCPTPGLELETGAEARTRAVAREFLARLADAAPDAAEAHVGGSAEEAPTAHGASPADVWGAGAPASSDDSPTFGSPTGPVSEGVREEFSGLVDDDGRGEGRLDDGEAVEGAANRDGAGQGPSDHINDAAEAGDAGDAGEADGGGGEPGAGDAR